MVWQRKIRSMTGDRYTGFKTDVYSQKVGKDHMELINHRVETEDFKGWIITMVFIAVYWEGAGWKPMYIYHSEVYKIRMEAFNKMKEVMSGYPKIEDGLEGATKFINFFVKKTGAQGGYA